ncbi:hypothetical protein KBX71_07235 [Micromonospora sp. D93]|uniref:hypothetical protein n=1 Tax=Micromonospora sp. D93 TaxID=2824886 RepID=UPI001B37BC0A|nr:hypothetical protein [Micromonospora sp. D93]MBQ1017661.1 hypothetical protein [Micromonospora sp. D93]
MLLTRSFLANPQRYLHHLFPDESRRGLASWSARLARPAGANGSAKSLRSRKARAAHQHQQFPAMTAVQ